MAFFEKRNCTADDNGLKLRTKKHILDTALNQRMSPPYTSYGVSAFAAACSKRCTAAMKLRPVPVGFPPS